MVVLFGYGVRALVCACRCWSFVSCLLGCFTCLPFASVYFVCCLWVFVFVACCCRLVVYYVAFYGLEVDLLIYCLLVACCLICDLIVLHLFYMF